MGRGWSGPHLDMSDGLVIKAWPHWSQNHTYDLGSLNILCFKCFLKIFTKFSVASGVSGHFEVHFIPRMVGKFRFLGGSACLVGRLGG